jgi:hypothetical protein
MIRSFFFIFTCGPKKLNSGYVPSNPTYVENRGKSKIEANQK